MHTPSAFDASPDADRFSYWGYRFEALCSGAGAGEAPPPARHGRPEWAGLFSRRLGGCDVLLAAETDGFCPDLAADAAGGATGERGASDAPAPPPPLTARSWS